jgi:hypothetical protein
MSIDFNGIQQIFSIRNGDAMLIADRLARALLASSLGLASQELKLRPRLV